jgi:hypothetical protein
MIRTILNGAYELDAWLGRSVGRPYHVILGIGLVVELVRRLRDIGEVGASATGLVRVAISVVFFAALFINQLAEFHGHMQRRDERTPGTRTH